MSSTTVNANLQANQNPEFARILRAVKKSLPMIAVVFTIGIYCISALAEGGFLNILIGEKVLFGLVLSYGISFGIQIGRMLLVYLPIMNAVTPRFNLVGEITGILLGAFAMASIWNLIKEIGFSDAVAITLCLLIVLGVVIEIYILRETKKQIKVNMLTDTQYMQDLAYYFTREKQMEQMLNDLDQGQIPDAATLFALPNGNKVDVEKIQEQMAAMQKENEALKVLAMAQRQAPSKAHLKKGLEEFNLGNAPTPSKDFSLNGIPEEVLEEAA